MTAFEYWQSVEIGQSVGPVKVVFKTADAVWIKIGEETKVIRRPDGNH